MNEVHAKYWIGWVRPGPLAWITLFVEVYNRVALIDSPMLLESLTQFHWGANFTMEDLTCTYFYD